MKNLIEKINVNSFNNKNIQEKEEYEKGEYEKKEKKKNERGKEREKGREKQKEEEREEKNVKINITENNFENEELIEINDNLKWKPYHENILVDWADKALCYRWLHSKSSLKYNRLRNLYTIPVIIISTLTGTANFALERIPIEYQGYCQIGIGTLNIFAGIISTISQFLKVNELSEAHRVASISWDKFYRNIRIELVRSPDDRINVGYLIKSCKDEYDRLMETCPIIDKNIINQFNKTFKVLNKMDNEKKQSVLKSLNKPEILDSLESTRNIVYKKSNDNLINIIKNKKNQIEKNEIIDNFIETFEKEFSRKPSIIEIYDNLDNKISQEVINKYINSNKWTKQK